MNSEDGMHSGAGVERTRTRAPLDRWRKEGRQQLLSTYYVSELV